MTEPDMRAELLAPARAGPRGGLRRSSSSRAARRSSHRPTARSSSSSARPSATTTPTAIPLPVMAPFATDAKHTAPLGRPDLRLLAAPARAGRALPRALPRRRRARLGRRAALGAARPVRRRPPLLRLRRSALGLRGVRVLAVARRGPARRRSGRRRPRRSAQPASGSCAAGSWCGRLHRLPATRRCGGARTSAAGPP